MDWKKLLTSDTTQEHRLSLTMFQASLAKLQSLTSTALQESYISDTIWNEIVLETAGLLSDLKTSEMRAQEAQAQIERIQQRQAQRAEKLAASSPQQG